MPEDKRQGLAVRLLLSRELGYEPEQITAVALGR
jgi:hypothetical protein